MLEERSPSACEARRVPFSCHSSPPLREPSELGDERREPSPRSHCQPSAGASVNDQPELWKHQGSRNVKHHPEQRQLAVGRVKWVVRSGSPGNRTLNLRIKSPLLCLIELA